MNVRGPGNVASPFVTPPRPAAGSAYARALDPTSTVPRGEREQWASIQQPYGQDRDALRIAALRRNAALIAAARAERSFSSADDAAIAGPRHAPPRRSRDAYPEP